MPCVIPIRSLKAAVAGKVFYISACASSAAAGTRLIRRIEPMRNDKD